MGLTGQQEEGAVKYKRKDLPCIGPVLERGTVSSPKNLKMARVLNEIYLQNFLEMDIIFRDESNEDN